MVSSIGLDSLRNAVRAGTGWVVFEAIGSPVGMDFFATAGTQTVGVGQTGTFVSGSTTLTVALPTLHSLSPSTGVTPKRIIRLYRINASGGRDEVATSTDQALVYTVPQTGIYRAEIAMVPRHLKGFLGFDRGKADLEAPWILTNPIYLE